MVGSTTDTELVQVDVRKINTSEDDVIGSAAIDEAKLLRRIDWHLLPWLIVLYLLSFLDRSAIGNARLFGLEKELKMNGTQYSIAVSMFFITYAAFEVPSNILLKRLRPSRWFPTISMAVGICMASQGLVKSYGGLVTARVMLGVCEAGLFPGVSFLLSGWYRKNEYGTRLAIFFSAAIASGAFGGLLAAAIHNMDGVGGYSGWRWIFICIGIVTWLAGFLSFWLVADFPETAKFLTSDERQLVIDRLQADQQFSAGGEVFKWRSFHQAIFDWKTWVGAAAVGGTTGALYAFSLFTPTIIKELGYTSTRANLVSVPIYVVACMITIPVTMYADKHGKRAMFILLFIAIAMLSYIVLILSHNPRASYAFIYLAAIGVYGCVPNLITLTSLGIEGCYKRSVSMGLMISWGNLNGAATSRAYASGSPHFTLGHGVVLLYLSVAFTSVSVYTLGLRYENDRRQRGLCNERILLPGFYGKQQNSTKDVSDDSSITDEALREATAEAARIRQAAAESDRAKGGLRARLQAARRRLDLLPGGTYATVEEAKALKGDHYSGFKYAY